MTLEQLIAAFRSEVEDAALPYLWTDADVVRYANRVLNRMAGPEEAGGAGYFLDQSTWAGIAITADDPVVPAPAAAPFTLVIEVVHAQLQGEPLPLAVMSTAEYQQGFIYNDYGLHVTGQSTAWQARTGVPKALLTDYVVGGYRLAPIPTQAYTLDLWARRYPLVELQEPSAAGSGDWKSQVGTYVGGLERAEDERLLLDGIKAYAYEQKHDADAHDPDAARRSMAAFTSGLADLAYRLRKRRTPARAVVPQGDYVY